MIRFYFPITPACLARAQKDGFVVVPLPSFGQEKLEIALVYGEDAEDGNRKVLEYTATEMAQGTPQ